MASNRRRALSNPAKSSGRDRSTILHETDVSGISPSHYRLFLFKDFRLEKSGAALSAGSWQTVRLPRRKVEALLAYLALHPATHTRDELAALFWGDSPDARARTSLRTNLAVLRKELGDDVLLGQRDSVQLNPAFPIWVDARAFEQTLHADPPAAVELYAGDLLPAVYDDWIERDRERLRASYLDALLRLAHEARARSEYESAIGYAGQVLAVDAANERAHQHLMFCYVVGGNRQMALAQYERCVQELRTELAVEPSPETRALQQWIAQSTPGASVLAAHITNLPIPLTSFIGRKREMAEVKGLLTAHGGRPTGDGVCRLLTLVGAGGSGKTRLAIQAATDMIDAFDDGVWWVELAALSDPALVPGALAKALAVREEPNRTLLDTLAATLRDSEALIVLDNCEHLLAACAELADWLLRSCLRLKILATSREPLGIEGEQLWHVPTLSVPDTQPLSLTQMLLSYESVRLFVDRARTVQPDFSLDEQNAVAVVRICQRLDGIPLAIELAAARVRVLSPMQIAARLDDRFSLLTQGSRTALPRQQTLRALIDWSYQLLADAESDMFQKLGVFESGWTLEAAESVAVSVGRRTASGRGATAADGGVLDLLTQLVNKSLVVRDDQPAGPRYRMLETIRDYSREKLRESGAAEQVSDQHLSYYLTHAERAEPELEGAQQALWLAQMELEHGNIRGALQWAQNRSHAETGLRMTAALWRFWKVHGHYTEGLHWAAVFLEQDAGDARDTRAVRARSLYAAGTLAYHQSDYARAAAYHREGLALQRELNNLPGIVRSLAGLGLVARAQADYPQASTLYDEGLRLAQAQHDTDGIATCLKYLGLLAIAQGDARRAAEFYEEALPLFRELGDEEDYANVLHNLGMARTYLGEPAHGQALTEESLAIRRRLGDPHGTALSLHSMSYFARQQGNWQQARESLCEALRLYHSVGTKENTIECLESIAYLEYELEHPERSAQLYGAAHTLRETHSIPLQAFHREENEIEVRQVRTTLDEVAFEAAWRQGSALNLEQAVRFALASDQQPTVSSQPAASRKQQSNINHQP